MNYIQRIDQAKIHISSMVDAKVSQALYKSKLDYMQLCFRLGYRNKMTFRVVDEFSKSVSDTVLAIKEFGEAISFIKYKK